MLIRIPITSSDRYKCKYCNCYVLPVEKFIFCDAISPFPQQQFKPHIFNDNKNNYVCLIYWCNCNNATFIKKN